MQKLNSSAIQAARGRLQQSMLKQSRVYYNYQHLIQANDTYQCRRQLFVTPFHLKASVAAWHTRSQPPIATTGLGFDSHQISTQMRICSSEQCQRSVTIVLPGRKHGSMQRSTRDDQGRSTPLRSSVWVELRPFKSPPVGCARSGAAHTLASSCCRRCSAALTLVCSLTICARTATTSCS